MAIFVSATPEVRSHLTSEGGAATVSGSAGSAVAEPADSPSMAEPVTRHALIPPAQNFQYLLCGFDSLDIGLFVEWGDDWATVLKSLYASKELAQKTGEVLRETSPGRSCVVLPGGKGDNYAFHLHFPEYHLFIAKTEKFSVSPNVYLSIKAEAMWGKGFTCALDIVSADLRSFGGRIDDILPSRLDICADYRITSDLTLPFLEKHSVCRSRDVRPIIKGGILETCYFGSPSAPIRLRIYNKGKEVLKKGDKLWFLNLWGVEDPQDIWRIEFQLRRPALKQFKINDVHDLWQRAGGLWSYLTNDWFSLRLPDNDRQDRRSPHTWWQEVQMCADRLGTAQKISRDLNSSSHASAMFYIAHVAGCLPAYAARVKTPDYKEAILSLSKAVYEHWSRRDFGCEYTKRAIKLGHGGAHGQE